MENLKITIISCGEKKDEKFARRRQKTERKKRTTKGNGCKGMMDEE